MDKQHSGNVAILTGKKSIDCVDKLREFGLTRYVSLPQIAVLGDQSSGKSSVLESISGIKFPRSSGLCTRFPTAIQMRNAPTFRARLRLIPGAQSSDTRAVDFDEYMDKHAGTIESIDDIGPAILTAKEYICGDDDFSDDILSIEMDGPNCIPVTLVDLPGYVKTSIGDQKKTVKDQIKVMCGSYLKDKRTIILAVIPANIDLANNEIFENASEVDPDGDRTIGVITKPDMMDAGTEDEIIDLVNNGTKKHLDLGYYIVKNRNNADLVNNLSNAAARESEAEFFTRTPWSLVRKSNTGAANLSGYLSEVLERHVLREMPNVQVQLNDMIRANQKIIFDMGLEATTASDMRMVYNSIVDDFQTYFSKLVDGEYTSMGDRLTDDSIKLRAYIRKQCDLLDKNLEAVHVDTDDGHIEQMIIANRGRELPGMSSDKVFVAVLQRAMKPWMTIIRDFVDACCADVLRIVQDVFEYRVASKHAKVHVYLSGKLVDYIKRLHATALDRATVMVEIESRFPATYNHYYSDNIEKIRMQRNMDMINTSLTCVGNATFIKKDEATIKSTQGVSNIQHEIRDIRDYVKAYYKVARKRVTDNIPIYVVESEVMQHLHHIKAELLNIGDVGLVNLMSEPPAQQRRRREAQETIAILERSREYLLLM